MRNSCDYSISPLKHFANVSRSVLVLLGGLLGACSAGKSEVSRGEEAQASRSLPLSSANGSGNACRTTTCDPSGVCTTVNKADGTACDDGNLCTLTDTCVAGACTGSNPVVCATPGQCRQAGTCTPSTGQCVYANVADQTPCFDANACTSNDACRGGVCTGAPVTSGPGCDGVACRSITRIRGSILDICAEVVGGTVDCWGSGLQNFGANRDQMLLPTPEPALTGARDWANNWVSSCVIESDGRIRCWGNNSMGALGDGTYQDSATGTYVSKISTAVRLASEAYSSCALLADGAVKCWGNNGWGQLGDGTTVSRNEPVAVSGLSGVSDIAGNATGVFALTNDHHVKYWGAVYNGAYVPNAVTPVAIPGFDGATNIAVGTDHACAVMEDASVKCVGANNYGQLGDGTTTPTTVPVTVKGLGPARKVVANYWYSCALLLDGSAACWGFSGHAVLGTDTNLTAATVSPVKVLGVEGATDIVAGETFNVCALMNGCSVKCWGGEGGMGIGTSAIQSPRLPRAALIPTELTSLSVVQSCRLPGSSQGVFIAKNAANVSIDSPAGQFNHFSDASDHHQPVAFVPGYVALEAPVSADGSALTWTLGATSRGLSSASPVCVVNTDGPQPEITIDGSSYSVPPLEGQADACLAHFRSCSPGTVCDAASATCAAANANNALALIDVCRRPGVVAADGSARDEAVFLYENRAATTLTTTIGVNNQFDGAADRGQPRSFPPGRGAFRVTQSSNGDSWTLGSQSLAATASSPLCDVTEQGTQDVVQVGDKTYSVPPTTAQLEPEPPLGTPFNGVLKGSFAVSPSGAATYSLPISIPPGIQGIAPTLALNYSSQGDNGIAGQGWSLSGLSLIYRCPKTIYQDGRSLPVTDTDEDAFCMDGNRLLARDDGTYETEQSDFSVIRVNRNDGIVESFSVETKSGETHKYGSRAESRFSSSKSGQYDIWGLDEVRDLADNYFVVHYNDEPELASDGLLATRIEYTGHGAAVGVGQPTFNTVYFDYEARLDARMGIVGNGPLHHKRRLHAIRTGAGTYTLNYLGDNPGSPSQLASIQYCGPSTCMDALSFGWDEAMPAWSPDASWALPNGIGLATTYRNVDHSSHGLGYEFIDLDGDGLPELLSGMVGSQGRVAYQNLGDRTMNGSHWKERLDWALPADHGGVVLTNDDQSDGGARLLDVDGDGLVDIVASQISSSSPYAVRVWLNHIPFGTGWVFSEQLSLKLPGSSAGSRNGTIISYPGYHFDRLDRLVDIDGDGVSDLMSFGSGDVRLGLAGGGWSSTLSAEFKIPGQIIAGATPSTDLLESVAAFFFGDSRTGKLAHLADVNNDGLTDIVLQQGDVEPTTYQTQYDVWINTGYRPGHGQVQDIWRNTQNWTYLPGLAADGDFIWNADLNGDGFPDIYRFALELGNWRWYWNDGLGDPWHNWHGWENFDDVSFGTGLGRGVLKLLNGFSGTTNLPMRSDAPDGERYYASVTDLNADGLPDLVIGNGGIDDASYSVRMNIGMGWRENTNIKVPTTPVNESNALKDRSNPRHNGVMFVDLNGDRLPEIVDGHLGSPITYKNSGRAPVIIHFPNQLTTVDVAYLSTAGASVQGRSIPLYTPELTFGLGDKPSTSPVRVVSTVSHRSPAAGKEEATREIYGYAGLRTSANGRGLEGFHRISLLDETRGILTETEYAQGYPYSGRVLRVNKSWWALKLGAPAPGTPISTTVNTYCDDWSLANYTGDATCQSQRGLGEPVFVVPVTTTDTAYLPNSQAQVTTTTSWRFDRAGNLKNTTVSMVGTNGQESRKSSDNDYGTEDDSNWYFRHGRVLQTSSTSSATGTEDLVHRSSFIYDDQTHRLSERDDEPGAGYPLEVHTAFGYDDYGNTKQTTVCTEDWASCVPGSNTPLHRSTTTSFDTNDFTPPVSPESGLITQLAYPNGLFVTKTTNALGQSEYSAFDELHGSVLQKTGPNGITTRHYLDDIGRERRVVERAGSSGELSSTVDTYHVPGAAPGTAQLVTVTRAATGVASWSYSDALGRTVETRRRSFDGGFITVDTEYDALGRTHRVSEPSLTSPPPYWSTTEYDGLDHVLSVTKDLGDLDGSGERSTTIVTNRQGFGTQTLQTVTLAAGTLVQTSKSEVRNVAGQVMQAFDAAGTETDFYYDAEGRLTDTWVPSRSALLTHIEYDTRGRKTSSSDSDLGVWDFSYDGFGEVVWQGDGRGQTTTQEYDWLGRMVSRTTTDTTGKVKTARWFYDTAPGAGVGKLAGMEGPDDDDHLSASCPLPLPGVTTNPGNRATRWFAYGPSGEAIRQSDCIDGETFTSENGYDALGRPERVTYPSVQGQSFTLTYAYNASGYLQYAADANEPSSPYWVARSQDARGNVVREYLRNGVETKRTRNAATGWLRAEEDVSHLSGDQSIQKAEYSYSEVGNLLGRSRNDAVGSLSEAFGYDTRDQLTLSQTFGPTGALIASDSPQYDELGNITSKDGHSFHYGNCNAADRAAGVHTLCQVDDGPVSVYDGNGSLVQSATHYSEFDPSNKAVRLVRLSSNGQALASADYVYGADGQRVIQSVTSESGQTARTVYVGLDELGKALYERTTRGSVVEHVHYLYAGQQHAFGVRSVTVQGGNSSADLRFYHTDHLGSVVAVSDASGSVAGDALQSYASTVSYDAWGARRNLDGSAAAGAELTDSVGQRGFTGHEMISALALVNMNGRIYNPDVGRFLSADPGVQFPLQVQSYNRYSYVLNNPLRYTDPTGYRLTPEEVKLLQWNNTIGTIAACAWNAVACGAAVLVSTATNAYIMHDQGVSSGKIVGVVAVSAAASLIGGGVGSGVTGALGMEGAQAAITQGAVSAAVQSAITSAVFDRGNIGENVLEGAFMGAVSSALTYGFQQAPALSQADAGTQEKSLDSLDDAHHGEWSDAQKRRIAAQTKSAAVKANQMLTFEDDGVKVTVYGGDELTRVEVMSSITDIFDRTQHGQTMKNAIQMNLSGDTLEVVVFEGRSGPGSLAEESGNLVFFNRRDLQRTYQSAAGLGEGKFTTTRIFAHELGHISGFSDSSTWGVGYKMDNVLFNENQVMRQLGDFNDRRAY